MWPETLRLSEVTRSTVAENLGEDMALLHAVNADPTAATLRLWESPDYAVVVGKSNVIEQEVDVAACETEAVPILRRESGGGAVVIGPGCLCFSLALPIPPEFPALGISGVTRALMQRLAAALSSPSEHVSVRGISDLAVGNRKICGNSQRWLRSAFLHHGTILYDFDLPRIARYLKSPSREPGYRDGRSHLDFVANLRRTREELARCLSRAWNANRTLLGDRQ
jgi:lipoate---protein ligase